MHKKLRKIKTRTDLNEDCKREKRSETIIKVLGRFLVKEKEVING